MRTAHCATKLTTPASKRVSTANTLEQDKLRIVHVVDYLMPQLGYQEFLLPKWNRRHGHDVHIVTSDRYTPIPSYEATWGRLLGPRILSAGRVCDRGGTRPSPAGCV